MIINIIYVHDECCIRQMNIKLLSLNEENENFEYTYWKRNMFQGPKKKGVLQLEGVLQLGGIRYVWIAYNLVWIANLRFTMINSSIFEKKPW